MQLFSRRLVLLLVLPLTTISGPATAQPILLEVIAPPGGGGTPIQAASGWSLTFRATAGGDPLIGVARADAGDLPNKDQLSYLVYSDPEGCFTREFEEDVDVSECLASTGATYIEFTPDFDAPDLPDRAGNERVRRTLTDIFPSRLKVEKLDVVTGDLVLAPFGPYTGFIDDTGNLPGWDGVGFGADDDLPSLFIGADTGASVALDPKFNRRFPLQQHNFGGLNTFVSYELDNGDGQTAILASFFAGDTFTPLVLEDTCLGSKRYVDGVLELCPEEGFLRQTDGVLGSSAAELVTVRAFLVNGTAPSMLEDLDDDLTVDVDDARMAGYQVLSNEVVVTFKQLPCSGRCPSTFPFDLDRNGRASPDVCLVHLSAKAGPRLTEKPR